MLTHHQIGIGLIVCALSVSQAIAAADERTQFPPEARKRYEQGRQLQQKGQLKEALAAYEEAAKLGMADFPRLHLQRASATAALKDLDTAIAQYTKFIEEFGLEKSCRY